MIKKIIDFILLQIFKPLINFMLNLFDYVIIFRFGAGIGDHLYLSSVIRQISLTKNKKIILFTNFPEFYFNSPRIKILLRAKNSTLIAYILKKFKGSSVLEFRNKLNDKFKKKHFLYYYDKKTHLVEASSGHFPFKLNYKNLRNEFFFSNKEKKEFKQKFKLKTNFAIIQSESKKTFTQNKEWKKKGMQNIIDKFNKINWIQVGTNKEAKLKNCHILFDLSLRELAYIINKSQFVVCYEGFINHLASCFNKKTFLIHTGFLPVQAFKYKKNFVIHNNKKMKCYPCYDLICKNHKKNLLKNLKNDFVIKKIRNNINVKK
jgi:ADP-heptose:LPS heptosyltransferase